ncbi:MAG: hypothetical protein WD423_04195 [Rhodothermales bacterium]
MDRGLAFDIGYRDVRRLIAMLIGVEILFLAIFLLMHVIFPEVEWGALSRLFDFDHEMSIPTWFSSTQLFAAGAVLYAVSRSSEKHKWFLRLGALVLVFASVDEGAAIHESISSRVRNAESGISQSLMINDHGAWIVPYAIAGVTLLVICARPALDILRNHRRPSLFVIGGMSVFVLGAVGLEISSYLFLREGATLAYLLEVAAEEFFEMVGVTIVLLGIVRYGVEVRGHTQVGRGKKA